jgi:hypothetical protein
MRAWRDALLLHSLFAAAGAAAFLLLRTPELGWGILGLVAVYNLLLPLIASRGGHRDWMELWVFLLPLSVLLVLPDWVLSQQFGILVFPDLGGPHIGTVPAYMAGMWVIPLFWILWLSGRSSFTATILALLLFAGAEWLALPLHLWHAQHVGEVFGVAKYVLVPEMLLGWATAYAFERTREGNPFARLGAAVCVTTFYAGALVLAYFLSEHVGLRMPGHLG